MFILDALANYTPQKAQEAEMIIERVTPRFQHVNSAVVLSAVKVVMKYMEPGHYPHALQEDGPAPGHPPHVL